jgi:hypothetical protein
MLDQMIRNITLDLMAEAARNPDPAIRAKLAEAFWDLVSQSVWFTTGSRPQFA